MNRRLKSMGLTVIATILLVSCTRLDSVSAPTVVIPKPGSGSIRIRLQFNAGSAFDPRGSEGMARYVAGALTRGTKQFTRAQIDAKLDELAADLNVEVDRDVVIVEGLCLTESWPEFSNLYLSVVTEPAFDPAEMAKLVDDQLDEIEQLRRDDASLAKAALQYFIYADHPYGHPVEGHDHSVKGITVDQARAFYQGHYTGGNYVLGLAGDVSDSLAQSVHRVLQERLVAGAPVVPALPEATLSGLNVFLIQKEARAQTQLRFGRPIGIGRDDADFMALFLANTHFGRHRESMGRLYQTIREERGLSYGAYAYCEHFDQDGGSNLARPGRPRRQQYSSAWVYPKSTNANFVVRAVLKEMSDLAATGLTAEQLQAAKTFEINHWPFEIETPRRVLGMRMDEVTLGTPEFVDSFTVRAERVTTADVRRAVKQAIDVHNMAIVAVVSDGEAFSNELLGSTVVVEYPSGVDPRELSAADAPYKNFVPVWDPQKFKIFKAEEMFR